MSSSKKAKIGDANVDKEVLLLIQEANANASAQSPFASGGLVAPPPAAPPASTTSSSTSSSSRPSPSVLAEVARAEELASIKHKLNILHAEQARLSLASSAAAPAPSVSLGSPEAFLDYFTKMEAARVKSAAEASVLQATARKEDLKGFEALSKKLTKKDGKTKHNLKQTAILLGTGEALSLLAEGVECLSVRAICSLFSCFILVLYLVLILVLFLVMIVVIRARTLLYVFGVVFDCYCLLLLHVHSLTLALCLVWMERDCVSLCSRLVRVKPFHLPQFTRQTISSLIICAHASVDV